MSTWEMARLLGWCVIRRTGEACDGCQREASNAHPVWLVSRKPEPSNHVCTRCDDCLNATLQKHMGEQKHLDSIVEEQPHAEVPA